MYYVFGCKEIHRRLLNNFKSPNDVEGRESIISKAILIVHVATSNDLEMFSVRVYSRLHVTKNSLTLTSDQLLQLDF